MKASPHDRPSQLAPAAGEGPVVWGDRMKQHELSALFPTLPYPELSALADDIKKNGLHSSIVLYQGKVLDGWHRHQACNLAGVAPRMIDYKGTDPVSFVKSANWHRRHLSASQKSLAEVALSEWLKPGNPVLTPSNVGIGKSTKEMAAEAQVSASSIERAKVVHANGSNELKAAVREGQITIDKAAKVAKLPKPKQAAALKQPAAKKPKPAADPKLQSEYGDLKAAYAEQQEKLVEMISMAESAHAFETKDEFKQMQILRVELNSVKRSRDQLQDENAELKREVISLRRKLDKLKK